MEEIKVRWVAVPPTLPGFWGRIRDDLVHGYHPKKEDLRRLWQVLTGETIHDGRRCRTCDGLGEVTWHKYVEGRPREAIGTVDCPSCDGTGWWARPTSMMMQRIEHETDDGKRGY